MEQVQNVTVKEGTNVTMECKVTTGSPPLTVFWENVKSGQVIEGKLLTINHITRYQTEYGCTAKNTCVEVILQLCSLMYSVRTYPLHDCYLL